ncbi:ankyrin repeat-containing protein At5g02620-like [Corylus avellana]|uniref:ankyrin repeat-containing protein At5g02620-like n=1 Tax=Corylus avellana TaxID=13451 RepID=UPI00286A6406|nr:ankyrin repeat-containing protein At5g02620-like [Corylus avellana]
MDSRLVEAIKANDTSTLISLFQANEGIIEQRTADAMDTALHLACIEGHREIVRILLMHDVALALQYNSNGCTPLHMASMNGKVSVLEEFVLLAWASFYHATSEGHTVFHLAVIHGQYQALVYLVHTCNGTNLIHCQDHHGNTCLHLAVSGGRHQMAEFLINKTKVEINSRNFKGLTALDILDQAKNSRENRRLEATFVKAGGRRSIELLSRSPEVERFTSHGGINGGLEISIMNEFVSSGYKNSPAGISPGTSSRTSSPQQQVWETFPANLQQHKRVKKRHRERIGEFHNGHRNRQGEIYMEALQNARNTIILVAILIATVTFSAGISPPHGGVDDRDGRRNGTAGGRITAFKVFEVSNNIALFTSLSIVIVLVSIIPFRRKAQMTLLTVAHKVMWVSVAFMATAYVAATWVVMPQDDEGTYMLFVMLIVVSCGSLGVIFIGLAVKLVEHWLRKMKWRKQTRDGGARVVADPDMESQNSDVESSYLQGYHSY